MPRCVLIRSGYTEWEEDERIQGRLDVPLCARGIEQARSEAEALRDVDFLVVYSTGDKCSQQTAEIIGGTLSKPVKVLKRVREVDLGLWQGMLVGQLKERSPRAYNRWVHSPLSVCPPRGESILQASDRLERVLKRLVKKHNNHSFALVCPPIADAVLRCLVKGVDLNSVWEVLSESPVSEVCEIPDTK